MRGSKNYGTFTQWNTTQQKEKKELLPFATVWMELESIMLSKISQAMRDKYHMISPLGGTQSRKQTSKQNITRDIEIKNNMRVTRGEGERDNRRKKKKGCQEICIKDTWTKPKWCEVGMAGMKGKQRQLYLNNYKKEGKKKKSKHVQVFHTGERGVEGVEIYGKIIDDKQSTTTWITQSLLPFPTCTSSHVRLLHALVTHRTSYLF